MNRSGGPTRQPPHNRPPQSRGQQHRPHPGNVPKGYGNAQPHNPNARPYIPPEERARRQAAARARREKEQRRREQQLAYERKMKEREKQIRRREFREDMKIAGGRFLVFLIVFVLLFVLTAGIFLISFYAAPDKAPDSGKIRYYYGGTEVRAVPMKDAVVGKDLYFCFNDLSDYLEMSESGSAEEMKFVLPAGGILPSTAAGTGKEQSIVFLSDTASVILNGQPLTLGIPNTIRGTEVWVSSDFVTDYMENLSFDYDPDKREVRISRIKDEEHSTDELTLYLEPGFILQSTAPVPPIEENPLIGDITFTDDPSDENAAYTLTFKTDVSAYEAYMNPEGDLRDAFLVLANTDSPLDASYVPLNLRETAHKSIISDTQYLSEYAAQALDALFRELKAAEFYSMAVYAGYRSYDAQSALFDARVSELIAANPTLTRTQAEKNAAFQVSRPGTDDHQTGLAVDMDTLGCVTTDFQYQPEYTWLTENAWKFGFILRYPKDKTTETNHAFEPWHFRFVGRYHAQKIHASGLCLEEYFEQIQ
ncbi:MAG: M15 family metallopeptidase [Clostridia bacterium]|nr:M15 family metallopeptidase [Clostridia bacterium]